MPQIVIVSASPLLAHGALHALKMPHGDQPEAWDVRLGSVSDSADAWVVLSSDIVVRSAQGAGAQLTAGSSAERFYEAVGEGV
jgi:hypothetical protein